jgi:CHAT domain-containing protein
MPSFRVTEARLSSSREHRACEVDSGSLHETGRFCAPEPMSPRTLSRLAPLLRSVARHDDGDRSTEQLHVAGLAELLALPEDRSRVDEVVELLTTASARAPGDWRLLNDLSVARLAQFEARGSVHHLLAGVEAADCAVGLAAGSATARFTLAVLLERLSLRGEAAREWTEYLRLDPSGPWADEARARLVALEARVAPGDVAARVERWASGRTEEIDGIIAEEPGRVRAHLIDVLLPRWAGAPGEGVDREALWNRIGELAERLARAGNDATALETVRALESLSGRDLGKAREALVAHGRASELYAEARYQASAPEAARALTAMRALGLPIAGWAANTLAANATYSGDYTSADSLFLSMIRDGAAGGSPSMRGRGHWGYSLGSGRRGLLQEAMAHQDSAAKAYLEAGEREPPGFLSLIRSEVLMEQGEVAEGLAALRDALRGLSPYRGSRRLHNALLVGAREVAALGYPRTGLRLQLEGLPVARATGVAQFEVEAQAQLARLMMGVDSTGRAADLIASARAGLPRIADPGMRDRNRADLNLVLAEIGLAADRDGPGFAALDDSLALAQRAYETSRLLSMRLRVYPLRARLLERAGQEADAAALLTRGVELVESVARERADAAGRATSLDGATELFDALISLQMRTGRVEEGLRTSERARATLGDASGAAPTLASAEEIAAALASSRRPTLLLAYALLPDRVVSWSVDATGNVRSASSEVGADEMARRVVALRRALRRGRSEEARTLGGALFEVLIEPHRDALASVERLLIVPDKALHGLPFVALVDPNDGGYLFERSLIAALPRASLIRGLDAEALNAGDASTLVVGAPKLPGEGLAALPQVEVEVAAVAGLYGRRELLEDDAVTRSAVLAALGRNEVFHFAGHALFDPSHPERSRLVVSDGATRPDEITSADISSLDLTHLRLVVLSACSTVSQSNSRTGGLQGLGQAFLAAGAGAVVGSLWPVDDRVAREFSVRFHEALVAGSDPAEALHAAQRALRNAADNDPRMRGDWAAFQLLGR